MEFTVDESGVTVTTGEGEPFDGATVAIDGQWLSVTVDDATALHGKTLSVSYAAKIRNDADLGPYANDTGTVATVPYSAYAVFDGNEDDVKSSAVEYVKFRMKRAR